MNKGLYTSNTDLWSTPQKLFDQYGSGLKIDVCAWPENAKCSKYFSPRVDGLKQDWNEDFWMNPPYGREIGKWVKKACEESIKHCVRGVCLLPSRTDTAWFHDWVLGKGEIEFLRGRLKFGDSKNSAPFPSIIVIYG